MSLESLTAGFGLGASLIAAIGAQNVFVLRQGLRRQYPLPIAFVCFAIDSLLILSGSLGLGALVQATPVLLTLVRWAGAIFLFAYSALALKRMLAPVGFTTEGVSEDGSFLGAILTTLAVSLLNPHVYLDTVVLIGSLAGRFAWDERRWFILGAMIASFLWFHSLALGARWLVPLFARPVTWRALDGGIAAVMFFLGLSLAFGAL